MPTHFEENPATTKESFICINCTNRVTELYKKYSANVLKLRTCNQCHELADKYIEFEPIITSIDLLLLSQPACRHVLFNTNFRIHWKLNFILFLLDAYFLWQGRSHLFIKNDVNFTKEKLFYFCFGLAILGMNQLRLFDFQLVFISFFLSIADNFILLAILRFAFSNAYNLRWQTNITAEMNAISLVFKTMTLARIAKFFLLPTIIWSGGNGNIEREMNFICVMAYYFYAMVQVLSGEIKQDHSQFFSLFKIYFISSFQ